MERNQKTCYDFIEIGTSDFRTLLQECDDNTVGLSIEPIQLYLDNLPNKNNVQKICCAISNEDSFTNVYYVDPLIIAKNNLPKWVRGCNSIGKPHPTVKNILGDKFNDLITIQEVKTVTWDSLIKEYNIGTIDYLKIDTEGHDAIILNEFYKSAIKTPTLFPKKILFENNVLSDKKLTEEVIANFKNYGYTGKQIKFDYELKLIKWKEIKIN